jgi:hypothetical protein
LIVSLIFSGVLLFRYAEIDEAYNRLDRSYGELNGTYNELNRVYDELNRTYFSHMPRELGFQTITDGDYSDQGSPVYCIVDSPSSWVEIWSKLQPHVSVLIENGSWTVIPPHVDFSESIVIAVFMGGFATGGYSIEVKEIYDVGQSVVVKVEKTYPGKNCIVTMALTQPYHIVKIDKTDKPIIFEVSERIIDCP